MPMQLGIPGTERWRRQQIGLLWTQGIAATSLPIQRFRLLVIGHHVVVADRPSIRQGRVRLIGEMLPRLEVGRKEALQGHSVQGARTTGTAADEGDEAAVAVSD